MNIIQSIDNLCCRSAPGDVPRMSAQPVQQEVPARADQLVFAACTGVRSLVDEPPRLEAERVRVLRCVVVHGQQVRRDVATLGHERAV